MKVDPLVVAERLFGAIEAGDAAAVRALYVEETTIWHNHDGLAQGKEDNLELLAWMIANVAGIRYEIVHRERLERGFLQQHVLRGIAPGGRTLEVPACMVVSTDDAGHVLRIDEYFDSRHVAPIFTA